MIFAVMKIQTQKINSKLLKSKQVSLDIKRIDLIDPFVSGNKWFKLKYNLIDAKKRKYRTILTFGGAYSNHIAATAYAAKKHGFRSIGYIRGEKHNKLNPTLNFAVENGMLLHYLSRSDYKYINESSFIDKLKEINGNFYLIPEGGTNNLALMGTEEIINHNDNHNFICTPVGTGGTISGIINKSLKNQRVIGFTSIKGNGDLINNISNCTNKNNFALINDYVTGGYAKINRSLVDFINHFYLEYRIPLDAIYTGKMMFGLFDLISKDYFAKGSSILAIHTGGIQGNKGMSMRYKINLPIY